MTARGAIRAIRASGRKAPIGSLTHSRATERIGAPHDQESEVPRTLTRPKRSQTSARSAYTASATTARSAGSSAAAPITTAAPIEHPIAPIRAGLTSGRAWR